ncbi:MAG: hypothetical protein ACI8W7_001265 [Gammaproteobacteria bacterium]|jgi:hypothetical protein
MPNAADPIPAITESAARGEIREIYQDIKAVTGVDVVNLVWRRLAVTKGALPAVWAMLRPAYVSGQVATQAQEFRRQLHPPQLAMLPTSVLTAAGVDRLGHITIRAILDSYNHTNAINLIGLRAVLARMDDDEGPSALHASLAAATTQRPLPLLPPLPVMATLDPHVRDLVEMLNAMCEQDGRIIASMYRHLAYWPGYLALVCTLLAPVAADGRMQTAIDQAREQAATHARGIAANLAPFDASLERSAIDDIRFVLGLFTQHPIAKMAAICDALSCATPTP